MSAKLLTILLTLLAATLVACGSDTQGPQTPAGGETTPSSPSSTVAGAPTAAPAVTWPSARIHPTFMYDSNSGRLLAFSGMTRMQRKVDLAEIWALDAAEVAWEQVAEMEPGDVLNGFAHDVESGKVIAFNNQPRQTWAYDLASGTWEQRQPAEQPADNPNIGRRFGPPMAYDAESDRVILFGGGAPERLFDDTWAYDYNSDSWEQMQPAIRPPARAMSHMAYDADSDRIILWGGFMEKGVEDNRVWAYDYNGDTWESLENVDGPQQHWERGGLVYLPDQDRFLLFSGMREHEDVLVGPETWYYEYDSNSWTKVEPQTSPPQLAMYAMAYDPSVGQVVIFGGELTSKYAGNTSNDLWLFDLASENWRQVTLAQAVAGE